MLPFSGRAGEMHSAARTVLVLPAVRRVGACDGRRGRSIGSLQNPGRGHTRTEREIPYEGKVSNPDHLNRKVRDGTKARARECRSASSSKLVGRAPSSAEHTPSHAPPVLDFEDLARLEGSNALSLLSLRPLCSPSEKDKGAKGQRSE